MKITRPRWAGHEGKRRTPDLVGKEGVIVSPKGLGPESEVPGKPHIS